MKRTYQPSKLVRKRRHGFRARMASKAGRQIINKRRAKGRAQLSAWLGQMAPYLLTIKKRSTFVYVWDQGRLIKGKYMNLQFLKNSNLGEEIVIGYTATKKIGNAVKRNKAKRIMRELAKKVILKFGKINSYYVLIAKSSILNTSFNELEVELKKIIS